MPLYNPDHEPTLILIRIQPFSKQVPDPARIPETCLPMQGGELTGQLEPPEPHHNKIRHRRHEHLTLLDGGIDRDRGEFKG